MSTKPAAPDGAASSSSAGEAPAAGDGAKPSLKERAIGEFKEYWTIAVFLAVFLGAFANYRRAIMAEAGLPYVNWGVAVVEALVLAKIILIGEALHLGERLRNRSIVVSSLWKSIVFGVLVAAFKVVELAVRALVKGESPVIEWSKRLSDPDDIIAQTIVVIVAFVPFFMLREVGHLLGEHHLLSLLRRRSQR